MRQSSLLAAQREHSPNLILTPVLDDTWEMPAEYALHSAQSEYHAMRDVNSVGVIDCSDRSLLQLTGADRHSFLQGMVTNDVLSLAPGEAIRAALLDTTGHILALLRIHSRPDALLIETDPRTLSRLAQTLDLYLIMEDVTIADVSDQWVMLALRGDRAGDVIGALPTSAFTATALEDRPGLDLWVPAEHAPGIWRALITNGAVPVGVKAFNTLRIESCLPTWGSELNEATLLPEAELADTISYTKGCYVGQEIIARLHARGHANRALRGVLLEPGAPVPHPGDTLHLSEHGPDAGREIGRITSAVSSPLFDNCALALTYVRREYADDMASAITVHIKQHDGAVFPFDGHILTRPFSA